MKLEENNNKYMEYLKTQTESEATIKGYQNDIKMFMRWMSTKDYIHLETAELTKKIIREYIDFLESENLACKTIKRRLTVLKAVLQYAYERDEIPENPFFRMHIKIKNNTPLPEVLELAEVNRYLYMVHNHPTNYSKITHTRDVAIIEILFSTGMRVAELANMQYRNWDAAGNCFRYIGKGNKPRVSFVENAEVITALQAYVKAVAPMESEYIFLSKYGRKMSTGAIRDVVKKYSVIAGIKKNVTPHTFRRSYATLLIDTGMDLSYVQKILGHSSIATTQIYVRLSEQSTRRALRGNNPRDYMSFIQ